MTYRLRQQSALTIAVALALSGCATTTRIEENNAKVDQQNLALEKLLSAEPSTARPKTPAKVHDESAPLEIVRLSDAKQTAIDHDWLRSKRFDFLPNRKDPRPIAANEVLKMFRDNGINVTSVLPLDNYYYSGNGLKGADGETALQMILGQMGLDYDVDNKGKFVTVIPMKSRSWTINLGNRTSHSTNSNFDSLCSLNNNSQPGQSSGTGSAGGGQSPFGSAGMGASPLGQPGQMGAQSSQIGGMNTASSSLQTQEQFWQMLSAELTQRLQILVPTQPGTAGQPNSTNTAVPNLSGQQYGMQPMGGQMTPGQSAGGSGLYNMQKIGHPSINPVTGEVTVQAPAWLLKQIDEYIEQTILPMYNTTLTFDGIVANVRSSSDKSTGIDLTALATYAGKWGIALNNNILGAVSFDRANGVTSASYSAANMLPGGGAAFGVISPKDNLQIFNAFLSTVGGSEIIGRPVVNTSSGSPVDLGRMSVYWANLQTQTLAAGNVNSNALSTIQNNYVKYEYGSLLRIMPHYDPKTRRVRALVSLLQKPLTGFQEVPSAIMTSSGSIQNQTVRLPNIECAVTSSEALLDDGEMIIVGGQVENSNDNSHSGVTGLMDAPGIDLLTSKKRDTGTRTTMYFAVRVRLTNKPTKIQSPAS